MSKTLLIQQSRVFVRPNKFNAYPLPIPNKTRSTRFLRPIGFLGFIARVRNEQKSSNPERIPQSGRVGVGAKSRRSDVNFANLTGAIGQISWMKWGAPVLQSATNQRWDSWFHTRKLGGVLRGCKVFRTMALEVLLESGGRLENLWKSDE